MRHAVVYYRDRRGRETHEVNELRRSLGPVRRLYGDAPAADFDPVALEAVRDELVRLDWCRTSGCSTRRRGTWAGNSGTTGGVTSTGTGG